MRAPDFWAASPSGESSSLLTTLLAPLGAGYDLLGRLRRAATVPIEAGCPVICVGNLVAGGAGKTPVVLSLAERLSQTGHKVHVLTRGYKGAEAGPLRVDAERHDAWAVGDEALLLAEAAPTWVSRDRPAGAHAAVAAGADLIVMDDGFQNPSLVQSFSLLVVDGDYGFGNGRVMPAGPLREDRRRGLARADAVVLLGGDRFGLAGLLSQGRPLLRARLVPQSDSEALRGQRVFAFAGIGRPAKFFASLAAAGAEVVERRSFPDHHPYRPDEIDALLRDAEHLKAVPVTTTKDAIRLRPEHRGHVTQFHVTVMWEEPTLLTRLLQSVADGN